MLGAAKLFGRGLAAGLMGRQAARGSAAYGRGFAAGSFSGARGVWGGGAAGAAWGAVSDDTSVLGGAMMGAGLGGAGMRYGGAGLRATRGVGSGMGFSSHAKALGSQFGQGAWGQMKKDFGRAKVLANTGYGKIKGLRGGR